ncbi:AcrR family transcriptional regulator [Microbacterium sp. AK009]|uniref:TetR/AcrR family transcriptional regulator n=1 Tax=Microbacterium sp. AK009 TaxID=2723068 RepID=UPI0015CB87DA|nr:TetR/AcrR family transcriptional regulator [Microbacterium sp. AK009]NYF15469.1 AcrR family transcriptional regulator [Microbacterium sp. AK009]
MAEDETRGRRRDAKRNEEAILEAAAAVFVEAGIQAPVRAVAERAGVGMGTLYRHFPTRADLVVALYQQQVDAAAAAGPALLRESSSPAAALHAWVALFVEFLVTKHGLADALQGDTERFAALHQLLTDRLVPVCADLLHAAAPHGAPIEAYAFLRGIGNLCIGGTAPGYDPERLAHLLVDGALASSGS